MIRVRIDLIPVGIEELKLTVEEMFIACQYPLTDDRNQRLEVYTSRGMGYAEIDGYNLHDTIYQIGGPNMSEDYLALIHRAIHELEAQHTKRTGKEIYPGMKRLPKEQEDAFLLHLCEIYPGIQTMTRFGEQRNPDNITTALAIRPDIRFDGEELFKIYEGYKPLFIAVRLNPSLYENSEGIGTEAAFSAFFTTRADPNIRKMRCFNGLVFFFIRPDGTITCPLYGSTSPEDQSITLTNDFNIDKKTFTPDELKRAIEAGQVIYRANQKKRKRHLPAKNARVF